MRRPPGRPEAFGGRESTCQLPDRRTHGARPHGTIWDADGEHWSRERGPGPSSLGQAAEPGGPLGDSCGRALGRERGLVHSLCSLGAAGSARPGVDRGGGGRGSVLEAPSPRS